MPLQRIPLTVTPCHRCAKIPPGRPKKAEHAVDMTPEMEAVYVAYRRFRAVCHFPDDELVAECALAIREAEDAADMENDHRKLGRLASLIAAKLR